MYCIFEDSARVLGYKGPGLVSILWVNSISAWDIVSLFWYVGMAS